MATRRTSSRLRQQSLAKEIEQIREEEAMETHSRKAHSNQPENDPLEDEIPVAVVNAEEEEDYEKMRKDRIRSNQERMKQLGISNLRNNLRITQKKSPSKFFTHLEKTPRKQLLPRRSSRLQGVGVVNYSEIRKKVGKEEKERRVVLREGLVPEVYTEEHEKLLGDCKESWVLFQEEGKRIYDQINGKTCHQCRQKTLGHRTSCCKCKIVQGQFCGDCLYTRYGENVLEASKNPDWICPVCRGICNCSLCRIKKGWAPTGSMYQKVARLGYKSVAHYLVQTLRSTPTAENEASKGIKEEACEFPVQTSNGPTSTDRKQPNDNRSSSPEIKIKVERDSSDDLIVADFGMEIEPADASVPELSTLLDSSDDLKN